MKNNKLNNPSVTKLIPYNQFKIEIDYLFSCPINFMNGGKAIEKL